ncbi:MAG: hypothetical protein HY675_11030 [Chloroflexi bacterium]|nr:hypothetical protein [Chloroflexota bacterium]
MAKRIRVPEGKALFFKPPETMVRDALVRPPILEDIERTEEAEKEPTRQSAVFLEERHIDWLEDRCREARRRGGRAVRKAAIIRALLDVAMESHIDLTSLRREEDLLDRIKTGLRQ